MQKKPDVRKLVEGYGYTRAKRKLRMLGFSKKQVLDMTDFLFTEEI